MKNELVSHQFLLFLVSASMLYSCTSILTLLLASWTGLFLLVSVQSFSVKPQFLSWFNFFQTLNPKKLPEKGSENNKIKKIHSFYFYFKGKLPNMLLKCGSVTIWLLKYCRVSLHPSSFTHPLILILTNINSTYMIHPSKTPNTFSLLKKFQNYFIINPSNQMFQIKSQM